MLIKELYGVKAHKQEWPVLTTNKYLDANNLKNYMQKLGFSYVNGGLYSEVFTDNKNIVKIFRDNDFAYRDFIKYCNENRNNPALPKFKGKAVRLTSNVRMIRMEILSPVPSNYSDDYRVIMNYYYGIYSYYTSGSGRYPIKLTDLSRPMRIFMITLKDLRDYNKDYFMDLHQGNVMMRGDQPVIIDPYAMVN
jgi:hypothetical protein